jgi:hypothetical protein
MSEINERLIADFVKCMLLHKTTQAEHKEVRFNEMLIKYLQSSKFTDLVKSSAVKEFH